ncbi:hypothetical protein [Telluribacter sp.]|jgi:hypothetical protein|uniref:hypothetical protein n=1 Tax=Telluribacter sp. TaxID=1978767 RepID=UPI002E13DA98|nr:hypothetical protein [Telluribacter sp.]
MEKSNIYVLIELEKFLNGLAAHYSDLQKALLKHVAYFQIIEPDYLSSALKPKWKGILMDASRLKDPYAAKQVVLKNQIILTISQLSELECYELAMKIANLFFEVSAELEKTEPDTKLPSQSAPKPYLPSILH